jgi:hypothetical protein
LYSLFGINANNRNDLTFNDATSNFLANAFDYTRMNGFESLETGIVEYIKAMIPNANDLDDNQKSKIAD